MVNDPSTNHSFSTQENKTAYNLTYLQKHCSYAVYLTEYNGFRTQKL